jgi:hypothetical protein
MLSTLALLLASASSEFPFLCSCSGSIIHQYSGAFGWFFAHQDGTVLIKCMQPAFLQPMEYQAESDGQLIVVMLISYFKSTL